MPTILVNPARRGLENGVAEKILGFAPSRIIYVSCNPRTLAADLSGFCSRGYRIARLVPFDMFPHTAHLEMVAVLDATSGLEPKRRAPRRRRVKTRRV